MRESLRVDGILHKAVGHKNNLDKPAGLHAGAQLVGQALNQFPVEPPPAFPRMTGAISRPTGYPARDTAFRAWILFSSGEVPSSTRRMISGGFTLIRIIVFPLCASSSSGSTR